MKNKILKLTTNIAALSFLFNACLLDSISYIPIVVCVISLSWISLFIYANDKGRGKHGIFGKQ
ncbi:MAG: hypothetical protein RR255_00025 [Bacilli bacterium]